MPAKAWVPGGVMFCIAPFFYFSQLAQPRNKSRCEKIPATGRSRRHRQPKHLKVNP